MRLLQLGGVPPDIGGRSAGGVVTHSWELSAQLAANGHEVALLANNVSQSSHPVRIDGVDVYGVSPQDGLRALGRNLRSIPIVRTLFSWFDDFPASARARYVAYSFVCLDVIQRFEPDVIHVHHAEVRFPPALIAAREAASSPPLVVTVHSTHTITQSEPAVVARFHPLVAKNVQYIDNMIYVSQDVREDFHEHFSPCPHEWVVPNPIDISRFSNVTADLPQPLSSSTGTSGTAAHQLLFVGNLVKRKGIYALLEAIAAVVETHDVHLTVVGDGPERDCVQSYAREQGIADRVSFEGIVDDVRPYYEAADLFVLPSRSESFGIVYLEAMACGVPVVGTTAVPEMVVPGDGICSVRVDPDDVDALTEGIREALSAEWDSSRIRAFANEFSWETCLTQYERIYAEVDSRE
ncbi:glycosyltransferase family 4 protein [Natronolimnobius baerhuensis]|uniref:Glycosyltransferase subfamily 4-like N-terminal domain-containing protein n=1 Tax=Natronolimnobius baerhuensis TaxID=253108 RepID=A0A202E752_9EURY|nr:glycosyltransferase family 4 protein [Natronolimnobius baerhuensis]OVE84085.1 hypothetical protein B2G88_06530 [Natronolimnobius baerhuensis]